MSLPVQYFRKLVESCPDIIIAVDARGVITFYNDGARQNLGFSSEEVLGKHVLEIYPSMEEARKVMAAMRSPREAGERGRVRNFETIFKTRKGEDIPVAISAAITYDEKGNEVGSIGFAKDLREIRRRDQLVTLAEIAIGLSHEIKNSLEVLVNHVELLKKYVTRSATDEDYIVESDRLQAVGSQIKRIQDITGRISEMADEGEYDTKEYLDGKMMTDLHVDETRTCERPADNDRYPLGGLKILVVDDDAGICQSLKDLLETERCCVETAGSGVLAMARLERDKFDLVLSDVVMPDMDGYELYQTVRVKMPGVPVVLMTAFNYDKNHIIKRSCLEGLQGVIFKKPVNPAMLKKLLLKQCRPEAVVPTQEK